MSMGARRNLADIINPIRLMLMNRWSEDTYQLWEISNYRDPQEFLDID